MIVKLEKVKKILQINNNSKDEFINAMIPVVQNFVFEHTNNYFEISTDQVYRESNTISFVNGNPSQINDNQNKFKIIGFPKEVHIRVQGSKFNDGIYEVVSVSDGSLVLSTDAVLINEEVDGLTNVFITVVKFPEGIKLTVTKLIAYHLDPKNVKGVQSESLGDHSISYQSGGMYPQSLLNDLRPYMRMKQLKSSKGLYNILNKR